MTNITNVITYKSDTKLGHLEISMTRLTRKHMQQIFTMLPSSVDDEGNLQYEFNAEGITKLVDFMADHLGPSSPSTTDPGHIKPGYVKNIVSDISIDGEPLTISMLIEQGIFFNELANVCMFLFRRSASLNEDEIKNSVELSQEDSAA